MSPDPDDDPKDTAAPHVHVHGPNCNHDHGHARQEPVRRAARPGRNDPCWCGSGNKYKKCHLRTDQA